ncbi:unnamed protein product [Paramecium primaurelia]|uniref:Uncharacterized protein n=6 Tax=Paramecium TaxID=5884 RepID=A0A8S1LU52_PARPR|nr:unnamed protein product [Paramecium primaurelia]CAD8086564.1 unnamed protein product [Paramecium sonneborni]CAD8131451.1 unnamed protein product [Paramecium pentaurelia]CAD8166806.1 unnamed protein product [Paramecium octaurelia]CAD8068876.1 unnamed protein product [Paramecium primaurelia]
MPIYNEVWEEEDFMFRNMINLQTLTKNHVKLLDNLKFEFVEYKANQLLACHLYDRMAQHCKNQFGLFEDSYVPECLDARNYFQLCVRMNASYGLAKKYFPEYFLTNEYSRPNPNFKELGL